MSRFTTHIIVLLFVCIASISNAQSPKHDGEIWLKNGRKSLSEQVFSYELQELHNDKFFRYLQFFTLPNNSERQLLKDAGVELLDYIPSNSYIAAIPIHLDVSFWQSFDIQAISPILPEDKLATNVDRRGFDLQVFTIQFQKNVSADQAQCFLEDNQIELIGPFSLNNTFQVSSTISIIKRLARAPVILYIEQPIERTVPEDNNGNAQHRSNAIATNFSSGRHYDGTGVNIAIGDDGFIGPHIDFWNRIEEGNIPSSDQSAHGDMVAGILSGAGNLNPNAQGIAKGASLYILNDFEAVEKAAQLYANDHVVITSTSYGDGCNRGYTTFSQLADQQILENPALMHVFSAGNAGDQDCNYGAGPGWGNITGGVKVGKNVLAVGNLDHDDQLVFNSSRGPSNDGRIKPDICANGEGQITAAPNNEYQTSSGSSAAAPVVSGILAQLYHAYRNLNNNQNPSSALMKAMLLNTADDLGNPGPDFSYGWGKANALRATEVLEAGYFFSDTIEHNQSLSFDLDIPEGVHELKVMLYWHDKAGSTVSSKSLVNDIDFYIRKNTILYYPWSLDYTADPINLSQAATLGTDHTNNMEQVVIQSPSAGSHEIIVNAFNIPLGPQQFYIVYEYIVDTIKLTFPFGNENISRNTPTRIHWDAGLNIGNFNIEFSQNMGQSWIPIATVDGNKRYYDWISPNIVSAEALIRISRNNISSVNQVPFHIYDIPTGLTITQVCPEYVRLEWNPNINAVEYTIYTLSEKYMDSIATTNNTNIDIPIANPQKVHWFAIDAIHENGARSQRTIAINDGENLVDCVLENDLSLISLAQPSTNIIQSCFDEDLQVSVNIKNEGTAFQSGFKLFYQYDNALPVEEEYNGIIPSGVIVNYHFESNPILGQTGNHTLKVWIVSDEDQALYNDSLFFHFTIMPSILESLPYFQNFDNFQACALINKCGSTCMLQEGWSNVNNESDDDIDWKIGSGHTPTPNTGPQRDQNSDTELGNYLYLEGSPNCINSQATLFTPCIDLSNSTEPVASFWYHMYGSDIGNLHLDIFDGSTWYNNIMIPIYGNQGADWQKAEIDLSTFSGSIINARFRGYTGDGYLTDLAIDNFSIVETASPPIADFILERYTACSYQTIQLFDNSYNEPLEWEWNIEPSSYSFVDGTSSHSPNPHVRFEATGDYMISLKNSNDYGEDEVIKYDIITISDGLDMPYAENFNNTAPPLIDWSIENFDLNKSWENISILGRSGQETNAIYVNNHSYNAAGQEDGLISKIIDLTNAEAPYLRFDYSYAPFNQNFNDALQVMLSIDCKESFSEIIFEKSGSELATAPNQMTGWTPHSPEDWNTEIIDLTDYVGYKVALKFVNICDFGNNLYIDNIALYEHGSFPVPDFDYHPDTVQTYCVGEAITFDNLSTGLDIQSYEWIFGSSANVDTLNSIGPHEVIFNTSGQYEVSLKAFNAIGWDIITKSIEVIDQPIADFSFSYNGLNVHFNNDSEFGNSYYWDFGDGFTSEEMHPIHTFANSSSYTVSLSVQNRCGEATSSQSFHVTAISEQDQKFYYTLQPNPAIKYIHIEGFNPLSSDFEYSLFNVSGKTMLHKKVKNVVGKFSQSFYIEQLPAGIYFLSLKANQQISTQKVIIF